jgi:hypothetical protein
MDGGCGAKGIIVNANNICLLWCIARGATAVMTGAQYGQVPVAGPAFQGSVLLSSSSHPGMTHLSCGPAHATMEHQQLRHSMQQDLVTA